MMTHQLQFALLQGGLTTSEDAELQQDKTALTVAQVIIKHTATENNHVIEGRPVTMRLLLVSTLCLTRCM